MRVTVGVDVWVSVVSCVGVGVWVLLEVIGVLVTVGVAVGVGVSVEVRMVPIVIDCVAEIPIFVHVCELLGRRCSSATSVPVPLEQPYSVKYMSCRLTPYLTVWSCSLVLQLLIPKAVLLEFWRFARTR